MSDKKTYFDPVDTRVKFSEKEKELLEYWQENKIRERYLQKNSKSKKTFSFLDGPITANNPMAVHHAWGRTYKDLWQRFYNMRGFRQRFQNGFDCQGLWVEVEVEKELGFKSKKDIEKFGVEKFVELCKKRVEKYSKIQTEQSKRLGYFADWDNSYYTLSDDNNYMIWHFLKVCHENGWIYKGNESVPWCPRCETAISQHEMLTEDYKEVTHESIYMLFPIKNKKNEYLLVWTTTPWTIPANIAVAVDTKIDYILAEVRDGRKVWLADAAKERVLKDEKYIIIKKVKGNELVGLHYKGVFDELPAVKKVSNASGFHSVISTDDLIMPISEDEGTGLVHTAVSAGTEDFRLGKKLRLPMIPVINDDATYKNGLGFLTGKNAKDNPRLILDHMSEKGFAYKIEDYTHRYPACWRCKTELVWKVTEEWYIAMDLPSKKDKKDKRTLRERMIDVAKTIEWIPSFGLDRELDWLINMHDWLISKKNRYWGLALPIWECKKCGNFDVIGSFEELKERVVEGWSGFEGKSPHKPQMDKLKIKCSKCSEVIERIEPVGNPWLDAGIVAFSTVSENNKAANFDKTDTKPMYITDKDEWKKWIPADFITESFPGQFKNWFYSLIAMSTVLEDTLPFKSVLGYATVFDESGKPMHKSWGNMIEFGEGAEKIGVDVMRWMYTKQNPAENLLFGYKIADETRRKFHLTLWNIYNFFVTYANLDGWQSKPARGVKITNLLDAWIVTRLAETIEAVTKSLSQYNAQKAAIVIEDFISDMSLWYIRRSRGRVSQSAKDKNDKNDFYEFTFFVLINLCKILAPFVPFISDIIFKNLTKLPSVHLVDWPDDEQISRMKDFVGEKKDREWLLLQMQYVRDVVEKGHSLRKSLNIPVRQPLLSLTVYSPKMCDQKLFNLIEDELNVKTVLWKKKKDFEVKYDTKITPELEEEAKTRELIRRIQQGRKNMEIELSQYVKVQAPWLPTSKNMIHKLKNTALVSQLLPGEFNIIRD